MTCLVSGLRVPACVLLVGLGAGCNAAVGNYFANRARDFGECFRAELITGLGIGGGVRAAGVADIGLGASVNLVALGVPGWRYGLSAYGRDRTSVDYETRLELPFYRWVHGGKIDGGWEFNSRSLGVPSALWAWSAWRDEPPWIWEAPPRRRRDHEAVWLRLHAFDVEVWAHAALLGARVGFSPGEFADFLLGWFGLDIAGDDRTLPAAENEG